MSDAISSPGGGQYLTFFVGGEEYAVGILRIKEILEFGGATRVPGAPGSVLGVINLRGHVVPVIDLAVKFGLPKSRVTPRSCVVIVETDVAGRGTVVGLLADEVSEVVELSGDMELPPLFGTSARVDYLRGVGRKGDHFVLILEIDRLLTAGETDVAGVAAADPVRSAEAPAAP